MDTPADLPRPLTEETLLALTARRHCIEQIGLPVEDRKADRTSAVLTLTAGIGADDLALAALQAACARRGWTCTSIMRDGTLVLTVSWGPLHAQCPDCRRRLRLGPDHLLPRHRPRTSERTEEDWIAVADGALPATELELDCPGSHTAPADSATAPRAQRERLPTTLLLADHPRWHTPPGRTHPERIMYHRHYYWRLRWTGGRCVREPLTPVPPGTLRVRTSRALAAHLPPSLPDPVAEALADVKQVIIVPSSDLWEAITGAAIRHLVQDATARRALYRRWCSRYGTHTLPGGPRIVDTPSPEAVGQLRPAEIEPDDLREVLTFLKQPAHAYRMRCHLWAGMSGPTLIDALAGYGGLGRRAAALAAADHLGDPALRPVDRELCDAAIDLAPNHPWPLDEIDFGPYWQDLATSAQERRTLAAFVLAHASMLEMAGVDR
ncbi:hypothetical protein BIV57_10890 [Mangrovactinospora gilvigrisea]|uniref:Uncharacterized protein n=1 Tax=Mangrovactinospora gilvigrisea TaxID=1428644 RepID=A0A1J7BFK7_9ACTN|nr:hypothetical protein [Mangrovactinospora gilvigrisea]OIV37467.1 hypothetical protein BIV57_10890 [Mangrovactinospora gilvigrisea]